MRDNPPQIENVGTVVIPVSQWKLGQLLLWLQRKDYTRGEPCPLDISMFPESGEFTLENVPNDGEVFHTFREVRFESGAVLGDLPKILCVFDRMRFTLPTKMNSKVHLNQDHDKEHMAIEAKQILEDEHGIVINLTFLQEALLGSSIYAESLDAQDLVSKVLTNVNNTLHTTRD